MSGQGAARLVVAYNADAGIVAGLLDILHKVVSPATYPCALCALTHGAVTVDRRWRAWRRTAPLPAAVFHRPDFRAAYPALAAAPLPLIARDDGGVATVLLDAATIARLTTVDALVEAIAARLAASDPSGPT